MIKVKFPTGETANELLHYMGADDEQNLSQRPEVAQRLAGKCKAGKTMELMPDEFTQLIKEVSNMLDIKADHVGDGEWNGLQQYQLGQYLKRINNIK